MFEVLVLMFGAAVQAALIVVLWKALPWTNWSNKRFIRFCLGVYGMLLAMATAVVTGSLIIMAVTL